jgi:hypothetical protein
MRKFLILVLIMSSMATDVSAKKKLYRWVDENGQVHYSDQVPPKQIKKEHQELSDHGVVLEKIGNARTDEEIKAEKDEKKRQIIATNEAEKEKKIRENIIKAYANENEITRLKEERISALERNIVLANQSLDFQKTSKEQLLSIAADNERNGIEVSNALKSRIKIIDEKILYQIEFIKIKQKEIEKVKEKFINDLKIYKEAIRANG